MRRNIRKIKHKMRMPSFRTRPGRRNPAKGTPILKSALLLLAAAILILIIIPFTITMVFIPETPAPEKTSDKAEQAEKSTVSVTDSIEKVSIPSKISVYRDSSGKAEKVSFEDYIKGVVASEMPSNFEPEALKAQAVAARTYSLAKYLRAKKSGNPQTHSSAPVCDTVHCQVYQDKQGLKKVKGTAWMEKDWKKISAAVEDTKGQLMYYKGKLVEQALFHSSSGGKTENCEDVFSASVPYLVSVDSPYEEDATHKKETASYTISDFAAKMKKAYPNKSFGSIEGSNIKIKSHSSGGRVEEMQIGSTTVTGKQVREALGLYSANFTISISDGKITFTTKGSGHGVGMSQYGANGMAKAGYHYKEILSHYYSGTVIL